MRPDLRSAVVFSGGGAYGAFQVGVVEALVRGLSPATGHTPLAADIYAGTSVGAYNAAFLASHWRHSPDRAAALLARAWIEIISQQEHVWGSGVVRYRANPFKFLNPLVFARDPGRWLSHMVEDGLHIAADVASRVETLLRSWRSDPANTILSLFDVSTFTTTEPFDVTLRRTVDYQSLRSSPKQLAVVATDWATGKPRIFDRDDLARHLGPSYLRGSASIPGLFQPTFHDGAILVDGGVVMNLPLEPAIEAGADVLYVVAVAPRKTIRSRRVLRSTVGSMLSAQLAAWRYALETKLEIIASFDYVLDKEEELRVYLEGLAGEAAVAARLLGDLVAIERFLKAHLTPEHRGLRPITVHVFQPEEQLGGGPLGMLDFHQDYLLEHLEEGRRQAIEHDCADNGCIVPTAAAEARR